MTARIMLHSSLGTVLLRRHHGAVMITKIFVWLLLIASCALILWLSVERVIAGDEGYYLYATELVSRGSLPYRDFFFPQMPLLPFIYTSAAWISVPIGSEKIWILARLLSGALTLLIALLLYRTVSSDRSPLWGGLSVVLLVGSTHALPVMVTVQTYALSTLLLLASFVLILRACDEPDGNLAGPGENSLGPGTSNPFFAGLCFGLAVATRLPLLGLLPLFLLHGLWSARAHERLRTGATISAGLIVASIPVFALLFMDSEAFIFDNLGYHLSRANVAAHEIANRKYILLLALLGIRESNAFEGYQFALLLWPALLLALASLLRYRALGTAHWALFYGVTLVAIHFYPSPAYMQYFSHAVPFFVLACVLSVAQLSSVLKLPFAALLIWYLLPCIPNLHTYTGGSAVRGMRRGIVLEEWNPRHFVETARIINTHSKPNDSAITFWSGYLVGTHLTAFGGSSNHFARAIPGKVSEARRQRLGVLSKRALYESLSHGKVDHFIEAPVAGRPRRRKALATGGYEAMVATGSMELWSRRP